MKVLLYCLILPVAALPYSDLESYVTDILADIASDPGNPDLYVELAEAYAGAGLYEEAAAAYREAILRSEDDSFLTFSLADLYLESGLKGNKVHLPYAIDAYRKALRKDEGLKAAYRNLGRAYYEMNQYENAANAYELYLQERPLDFDTLWKCGLAYEGLGRYDKALEKYRTIHEAVTGPFVTAGRVGEFGTADDLKKYMDRIEKEHLR